MVKGRLQLTDKYAIQGMLHQGKTVKEIQMALDRPRSKAVEKYINDELKTLQSVIAKVKSTNPTEEENNQIAEFSVYAVHKLINDGLERHQAENLVKIVLEKITFQLENEQQLYIMCVQHKSMAAKNFMTTKTVGGADGIAIMTQTASMRTDESSKQARSRAQSRSSREAIFQPKDGKIRGKEVHGKKKNK